MASSPKPPNPYDTASAQQAAELGASQASGIINNPNEQNPYGTVNYQNAGYEIVYDAKGKPQYVPRYNRITQLSPDQMKLLGLETQTKANAGQAGVLASSQLADQFRTQLDPSQWQQWAGGQGGSSGGAGASGGWSNVPGEIRQDQAPTDRAAVEEAMLSRYRENSAKSRSAEDAQLAARGLNPGSQGYGNVADTRSRADTDAQMQAYLASGDESRSAQNAFNQAATQRYQMGSDYASFLNNLRLMQQQSDTALRNQLPNEIAALMGMGQVTVPQFTPMSRQGINAPDVSGLVNNAYSQQLAASQAKNQGIFGLAGSLASILPFSDRRLKTHIKATGEMLADLPLYTFRFLDDPNEVEQTGVMADEARTIHPDAVHVDGDGYDHVDYALLISRHEGGLPDGFQRRLQ